jgi:hypothetical protein
VRQPPRSAEENPARTSARGAQRAGVRHDRRKAAQDHQPEVIVTQMVNNAAGADLRATKMLIDMM